MNMPYTLLQNQPSLDKVSSSDVQAVLVSARRITQTGEAGHSLHGRHVAVLCESPRNASAKAFTAAAQGLGARVVRIRPSTARLSDPAGVQDTARLLGRLYCALGCDGIQPAVLMQVTRWTGVPVFEAVSADTHPTRLLGDLLTMCADVSKSPAEITLYVTSDSHSPLATAWQQLAKLTGLGVRTSDSEASPEVSDFVYEPQASSQYGALLSLKTVADGKRLPRPLMTKQTRNHVSVLQALLTEAVA